MGCWMYSGRNASLKNSALPPPPVQYLLIVQPWVTVWINLTLFIKWALFPHFFKRLLLESKSKSKSSMTALYNLKCTLPMYFQWSNLRLITGVIDKTSYILHFKEKSVISNLLSPKRLTPQDPKPSLHLSLTYV